MDNFCYAISFYHDGDLLVGFLCFLFFYVNGLQCYEVHLHINAEMLRHVINVKLLQWFFNDKIYQPTVEILPFDSLKAHIGF